jgi:hypothetical protein
MQCRVNNLPDPEIRAQVQGRIEAILAPHADRIRFFDLTALRDEDYTYLKVYWCNPQRADTIVTIHDETTPDFASKLVALLAP